MTAKSLVEAIKREAKPVRAVITDSEATLVLSALGLRFEIGLARDRGDVTAAWGLIITVGGAAAGGALGVWLLGGTAGLLLGAIVGGALAARTVHYRLAITLLPDGAVALRGQLT
jgi:hypothetical protein